MFMATSSIEVAMDRACGVRQPPTAPGFTERQGQYLAFIDAYTRVRGRPPAEADLQHHFGVSAPSVHQMVVTLERAGLIRRQSGWRAASRCWWIPDAYPFCSHPNPSNPLCRGTSTNPVSTSRTQRCPRVRHRGLGRRGRSATLSTPASAVGEVDGDELRLAARAAA